MNPWRISINELHSIRNTHCVIFDCRFALDDTNKGLDLYKKSHIPGAIHLNMENDLSGKKERHGGRHPLPETQDFEKKMRGCGVNHDSLIIAYDDNRLAGAARLWWLLTLFGHSRIKILDGGFTAWNAAHFETASEPSNHPKDQNLEGNFEINERTSLIVDHYWVRQHLTNENVTFIDAREPKRYLGQEEPIDPIAGHIPGAINAPWLQVTTEDGFIKPIEQQQLIWHKLPLAQTPVVYCGSGVTACVNLLSLSLAGIENAKLYAGSWSDWCSYPANPVEPPRSRPAIQARR